MAAGLRSNSFFMAEIMDGIIFGGQLEDLGGSINKEDSRNISIRRSSGGHKIATFLRQNGYDIDDYENLLEDDE